MFKPKYRLVKEEGPVGTVWYTEIGTWFLWWSWQTEYTSMSCDAEKARKLYVDLTNNIPLEKKTIICSR